MNSSVVTDKFKKSKYNFKKGNYEGMRSFFDNINWSENFENKNVGDCYKKFLEIYEIACSQFIPKINVDKKRKMKPPWLTRELRELMRVKSNLWHAFTK